MDNKREAYHRKVAEKLIEQLEQGTAPWQRPWAKTALLPYNASSGQRYKGVNSLHLMSQGRSDARWMTYKQAQAIGAQVREGEQATLIQYAKYEQERVKRDEQGKPLKDKGGKSIKETLRVSRPRLFNAFVFNAEQIDNLPAPQARPQPTWNPLERAEQILAASNATLKQVPNNRAFYHPATDSITLPEQAQFPSPDGYYATALHELGHWTGHASRLARDLKHPFGSEGYAKEELRAEIASMMLGQELAIGHDPGNHASYVGAWIKLLKDDPQEIYRAASDAEKIHNYVLALEHKQELSAAQKPQEPAEAIQRRAAQHADEKRIQNGLEARDQNRRAEKLSPAQDGPQAKREAQATAVAEAPQPTAAPAAPDNAARLEKLLAAHPEETTGRLRQTAYNLQKDGLDSQPVFWRVGQTLPAHWTGEVQVLPSVRDIESGQIIPAELAGRAPEGYAVYAGRGAAEGGQSAWKLMVACKTLEQAEMRAEQLQLLFALITPNTAEQAAKITTIERTQQQRLGTAPRELFPDKPIHTQWKEILPAEAQSSVFTALSPVILPKVIERLQEAVLSNAV